MAFLTTNTIHLVELVHLASAGESAVLKLKHYLHMLMLRCQISVLTFLLKQLKKLLQSLKQCKLLLPNVLLKKLKLTTARLVCLNSHLIIPSPPCTGWRSSKDVHHAMGTQINKDVNQPHSEEIVITKDVANLIKSISDKLTVDLATSWGRAVASRNKN